MAGRPRKTTAEKMATGNPGKRALPKNEPEPAYLNDLSPPAWLSAAAREVWLEEAPRRRKALLLSEVDVMAFGMLCESFARYRRTAERIGDEDVKAKYQEDEDGNVRAVGEHMNPWAMLNSMYFKQVVMLNGKFGGTPQDRTRVEVNPQGDLFAGNGKPKDAADPYFH
jgi:P27 family predicted phage terminase small subunit